MQVRLSCPRCSLKDVTKKATDRQARKQGPCGFRWQHPVVTSCARLPGVRYQLPQDVGPQQREVSPRFASRPFSYDFGFHLAGMPWVFHPEGVMRQLSEQAADLLLVIITCTTVHPAPWECATILILYILPVSLERFSSLGSLIYFREKSTKALKRYRM